jgi:hypothetical protein
LLSARFQMILVHRLVIYRIAIFSIKVIRKKPYSLYGLQAISLILASQYQFATQQSYVSWESSSRQTKVYTDFDLTNQIGLL